MTLSLAKFAVLAVLYMTGTIAAFLCLVKFGLVFATLIGLAP